MSQNAQTKQDNGNGEEKVPAIAGPRLPYHPSIEERFGVDRASWKALVEAVFPAAQSAESVILALSYCRARNLDPFKRNVHIVPIWDKEKRRLVDTVWPGIGELRTTAFRTKQYAGRDATKFGPDRTETWNDGNNKIEVTFPEWAQVTVYRMIDGQRVAFEGPPVYWMETYAESKGGVPNSMWRKRPRGQLDKCSEAAALRAAFPEEVGDDHTDAEAGMIYQHGGRVGPTINHEPTPSAKAQLETFAGNGRGHPQESQQEDPPQPAQEPQTPEQPEPPEETPPPPQQAEGGAKEASTAQAAYGLTDPDGVVSEFATVEEFTKAAEQMFQGLLPDDARKAWDANEGEVARLTPDGFPESAKKIRAAFEGAVKAGRKQSGMDV